MYICEKLKSLFVAISNISLGLANKTRQISQIVEVLVRGHHSIMGVGHATFAIFGDYQLSRKLSYVCILFC
jgi:hypothetical protein